MRAVHLDHLYAEGLPLPPLMDLRLAPMYPPQPRLDHDLPQLLVASLAPFLSGRLLDPPAEASEPGGGRFSSSISLPTFIPPYLSL